MNFIKITLLNIFYILMFFILFFSCNEKNKYSEKPSSFNFMKLKIDTLDCTIKIDSADFNEYKIFSVTNNGVFCGYNGKNHSVYLYSLNLKKQIGKFKLNKSFEKTANESITGIYIQNIDSIFVLSRTNISLYNSYGKVLKKTPINIAVTSSYFNLNYLLDFSECRSFTYDSLSHVLYIPSINPTISPSDLNHYESPFITEYNLVLNKFNLLPIKYSNLYLHDYYGFMTGIQFSLINKNKDVLYNFPIDPNIYLYNMKTDQIRIFGGKARPTLPYSPISAPLDKKFAYYDDKKILHLMENIRYYKIFKDGRGLFYRPYEEPVEYKTEKSSGRFPNFGDKKRYITVFDSNFNIIYNLNLNEKMFLLGRAFVTKDGLYVPSPLHNSLYFKIFRIKT